MPAGSPGGVPAASSVTAVGLAPDCTHNVNTPSASTAGEGATAGDGAGPAATGGGTGVVGAGEFGAGGAATGSGAVAGGH